ncbi:MAG: crotonase/enoyl-CoA hydratase family protein [Deltaproteobacteria bacterium]|nr:crotonase/enoyl-CoA hydratase family protein [Deltaproteobacteria bacterium]
MPDRLTIEIRDHLHLVGLNRADKRNAFDRAMLRELAEAFTAYEDDDGARCLVLYGHGEHFTAGLDLGEVGPAVAAGEALFPDGTVDPLGLHGRVRKKPFVMAVSGWCLTIGIELLLAADVRVAADDARFGQIEINRGIFPFGGATIRMPAIAGWGNAMRWLLTGDIFPAAEAHRLGLVQEVTPAGGHVDAAIAIAETIAKRAPLGVRATLESARLSETEGPATAIPALLDQARRLMASKDAAEGLASFLERREATFRGE